MLEALRREDLTTYLRTLAGIELVLPMAGVPTGGQVTFATLSQGEQKFVATYTSPQAMVRATNGAFTSFRKSTLAELAEQWPNEDWWLAVDGGLAIGSNMGVDMVRRVAAGDYSPPNPAAQQAQPVVTRLAAMQKVIPHEHVQLYLGQGYDRVAGYVHRFDDVRELRTVPDIVQNLGLQYEGSPFSVDDEFLFVIRWNGYFAEQLRIPYGGQNEETVGAMPGGWVIEHPPFLGNGYVADSRLAIPEWKIDSCRLPHRAEMWRIAQNGEELFAAVYSADMGIWQKNSAL